MMLRNAKQLHQNSKNIADDRCLWCMSVYFFGN